jgi:hypothetical protein
MNSKKKPLQQLAAGQHLIAARELANDIESAIRSGRLLPEDLVYGLISVEVVRAIQEIPWDKYETVSDDVLEEMLWLRGRQQ